MGNQFSAGTVEVPTDALINLVNYQEQCDEDGVMVKVSRQALAEVLLYVQLVRPDLNGGPQSSWQPIETAPKDGTPVDLWIGNSRTADAYWGRPDHSCGEAGSYCDCCPSYDGWCDVFGYLTGPDGSSQRQPTHWMPRPGTPLSRPEQA